MKIPLEAERYEVTPFELYCPSICGKSTPGICPVCSLYWPSAAAMKRHKKCHGRVKAKRRPAQRLISSSLSEELGGSSSSEEDNEPVTAPGSTRKRVWYYRMRTVLMMSVIMSPTIRKCLLLTISLKYYNPLSLKRNRLGHLLGRRCMYKAFLFVLTIFC